MNETNDSDRAAATRLWNFVTAESPHLALLTTVRPDGAPHATWMGAARCDDPDTLLTITSPDSDKVVNIRANPKVEWLTGSPDRKELLYLMGEAEVVEDVAEIKRCWQAIPGKGKTFFIRYYNSGIGFAVVKTRVKQAVYVVPEENRKTHFEVAELHPS